YGAGSFQPIELSELRKPILGRQRDQVIITWVQLGIADRFPLGQDTKLVSEYCTDLLHTKNSWGRWLSTRPSSVLCQPHLFLCVYSRSSWDDHLHRACWTDAVRDVGSRVAVRDLLGWLGEELAFSRIAADLMDDVDWRVLWSWGRKRERQHRSRMLRSFLCVTPQGWPRWRVLVLDYLLDDAMRHALKLVHQALRVPMRSASSRALIS